MKFLNVLLIFMLIFSWGCSGEEAFRDIYLDGETNYQDPAISELPAESVDAYITDMLQDPQSPETFMNSIPGYFNFCGVIASAGNIELEGNTKIIGGLYSLENIVVSSGVVIVEDIDCINKTRESLHSARDSMDTGGQEEQALSGDSNEILNVFHNNRYPLDMKSIPSRVIIMKYTEIPANEKSLEESSFDKYF